MKFGKRRWEAKLEKGSSDAKTASDNPALESWTVRAEPAPEAPASVPPPSVDEALAFEEATVVEGDAVELPLTEVAADDEPAAFAEPLAEAEPEPETAYVEAEPETAYVEPEPEPEPAPEPEPEPVAREPEPYIQKPALSEPLPPPGASWAPSPPDPPAPPPMPYPVAEERVLVYTSAADTPAVTPLAEAGEAYASGHAQSGTSPSWPEPVMELAAERPEVLVGAAFAGGLVLALILRRLGN